MTDDIQFWQAGEWTMVYLNGELVRHGDHYLADEWLQERVGVVIVQDDDHASVPDGHHPVHLLAEAQGNRALAEERRTGAARLREQAAALLTEADALVRRGGE